MTISWLLIVVLVIFAVCLIRGWWRGLLRILFSLVSIIVLIGLVSYATPHVSTFIKEHTTVYETVQESCAEAFRSKTEASIEGALGTDQDAQAEGAVSEMGLPQMISSYITGEGEAAIESTGIYDSFGARAADLVLAGASFFITLILAIIIVKIVGRALDIVNHIPVLKGINRTLGLIAGAVEGYILVSLVFLFIALIAGTEAGAACTSQLEDNFFLSFLYEHNLILKLLSITI